MSDEEKMRSFCRAVDGGVVVEVKAQPGAKHNKVAGVSAGALKVMVTCPPEKGKANEAIADVLAEALGVRPSAITLLSGMTSRKKAFRIAGVTVGQIVKLSGGAG